MNKRFHLQYAMIVSHYINEDKAKWLPIWAFHMKQYLGVNRGK